MAGGVGSRFWPISRTSYPKQFIDILGTGQTLIQQTYQRFLKIVPAENIFILTNELYENLVLEQLSGIDKSQILAEPIMRNTAPCIAYGSHKIQQINPDAAIVVAPSDHLILDTEAFIESIRRSLKAASENDYLITLGIKPSRPDTGYGYIQYNTRKIHNEFYKVKTFTEKPNEELARTFIQSGDFLWNAGIFVWSTKNIISSFQKYLPEIHDIFNEGARHYNTEREKEFVQSAFTQCTNISIDYGIMEKADNVYVLPSEFGWSDLGTWASVYELSEKDYVGNAVSPTEMVIMHDSSNCMVNVPKGKLVVLKGLHDFIVVEANNTLLISPRNREQEIRQVVTDVKQRFGSEFI